MKDGITINELDDSLIDKLNKIKDVPKIDLSADKVRLDNKDYEASNVNDALTEASLQHKKINLQYKEVVEQLGKESSSTIHKEGNIINLYNDINGVANVEIGGNTIKNLIPNSKISETSSAYGFGGKKITQKLIVGKEYTLIVNGKVDQKALDTKKSLTCFIYKTGWGGYSNSIQINTLNCTTKTLKIVPNKTEDFDIAFYLYPDGGDRTGKATVNWCMLLEGDWTNKPIPEWFDGIKSVGELENNKVEIKSCGKNLFDINNVDYLQSETHNFKDNKLTITSDKTSTASIVSFNIKVNPNTTYTFNAKSTRTGNKGGGCYIADLEGSNKYIYVANRASKLNPNETFTTKNSTAISIYLYGESEGTTGSSATYWDIQLEEGTKATQYEPYTEDKVEYTLKEPLRSLPDGTRDTINADGTITRRVGKVVLDGSEDWSGKNDSNFIKNGWEQFNDSFIFALENNSTLIKKIARNEEIISDLNVCNIVDENNEGIVHHFGSGWQYVAIRIKKNKLSTQDIQGFKQYLKKNPTTVYYELAEQTTETVGRPLILKTFKDGTIQSNTSIAPLFDISYPTNMNSKIINIENNNSVVMDNFQNQINNLKTHVDNGKSSLYSAIVGKKVTPRSKDFENLTKAVNDIKLGQGTAQPSQVLSGATFTNDSGVVQEGILPNMGSKEIEPKAYSQELGKGYYDNIKVEGFNDLNISTMKEIIKNTNNNLELIKKQVIEFETVYEEYNGSEPSQINKLNFSPLFYVLLTEKKELCTCGKVQERVQVFYFDEKYNYGSNLFFENNTVRFVTYNFEKGKTYHTPAFKLILFNEDISSLNKIKD